MSNFLSYRIQPGAVQWKVTGSRRLWAFLVISEEVRPEDFQKREAHHPRETVDHQPRTVKAAAQHL